MERERGKCVRSGQLEVAIGPDGSQPLLLTGVLSMGPVQWSYQGVFCALKLSLPHENESKVPDPEEPRSLSRRFICPPPAQQAWLVGWQAS